MAGLYLHIPFCKQACYYCNFHFSTQYHKYKDEMLAAMLQELSSRSTYLQGESLSSIYFGGGTPSLLSYSDIEKIFEVIHKEFKVETNPEVTVEANPDDISPQWLHSIRTIGINRLSIGVQSFQRACLEYMHRCHTVEDAHQAIMASQDAGIDNISIDLIFGTPTLSQSLWEDNLSQVIVLDVPHISCYALTVEPDTALSLRIKKQMMKAPQEQPYLDQFLFAHDYLSSRDYIHYEISNYARRGYKAIHNGNYWLQKKYLGIGPSAHSYNGSSRSWNIANNTRYMKSILEGHTVMSETEILSTDTKYNEYVMVGIRTDNGINIKVIESQYGHDYAKYFLQHIQPYIMEGLVVLHCGIYTLSRKGMLYADRIASDCFIA